VEARRNSRQQVARHSRRLAPPASARRGFFVRPRHDLSLLRATARRRWNWRRRRAVNAEAFFGSVNLHLRGAPRLPASLGGFMGGTMPVATRGSHATAAGSTAMTQQQGRYRLRTDTPSSPNADCVQSRGKTGAAFAALRSEPWRPNEGNLARSCDIPSPWASRRPIRKAAVA
jgi:hypothetical protein